MDDSARGEAIGAGREGGVSCSLSGRGKACKVSPSANMVIAGLPANTARVAGLARWERDRVERDGVDQDRSGAEWGGAG